MLHPLSRGELPEEAAAAYERQRRTFEALQRSAATLAEALERPLPALPDSDVTRLRAGGGVTIIATRVRSSCLSYLGKDHSPVTLCDCMLMAVQC